MQPIRTAAEIHAHIKILPVQQLPLYQKIAQKAMELRLLGMTYPQIAKALNISKKTARHRHNQKGTSSFRQYCQMPDKALCSWCP